MMGVLRFFCNIIDKIFGIKPLTRIEWDGEYYYVPRGQMKKFLIMLLKYDKRRK